MRKDHDNPPAARPRWYMFQAKAWKRQFGLPESLPGRRAEPGDEEQAGQALQPRRGVKETAISPGNVPSSADLRTIVHDLGSFKKVQEILHRKLGFGCRVALCGLGGAGKTYAAIQFANDLRLVRREVKSTFFVPASSPEILRHGLASLAQYLNLPEVEVGKDLMSGQGSAQAAHSQAGEDLNELTEVAVGRVLDALCARDDWLIIFDNMDFYFDPSLATSDGHSFEDVRKYFPNSNSGRILITTRDLATTVRQYGIDVIDVESLSEDDSVRFLLTRAGLDPDDPRQCREAREIVALLGKLPLALDVAAAYVRERIDEDGGYTLASCAQEYGLRGSELRRRSPDTQHPSVYLTFSQSFARLETRDSPEAKLASALLRICAHFAPESIPVTLLQKCTVDSVPGKSISDSSQALTKAAIQAASRLRLLEYVYDRPLVSVHREIHAVLRDIVDQEDVEKQSRNQALHTINEALSEVQLIPLLHPHVEHLRQDQPDFDDFPRLKEYLVGVEVLKALEAGDSWEQLVFGAADASYQQMRQCIEGSQQRELLRRRMAAIRSVCSENHARVVFACVYFLVHYWWDGYLASDRLADPLLDIWRETGDAIEESDDDRRLFNALKSFHENFPPVSDYKERLGPSRSAHWRAVGAAIHEIRSLLGIESVLRPEASSALRYARGITNIYLADVKGYEQSMQAGPPPEDDLPLELCLEAEHLFEQNLDRFHVIWARREIAERLLVAGLRCSMWADENPDAADRDRRKAAAYFGTLQEKCGEGLHVALELAREGELDAEVIADFYSVLGSAAWHWSHEPLCAAGFRFAAVYAAYAFVLSEEDVYSLRFYSEQVERTIDWLMEVAESAPAVAADAFNLMRRGWSGRSLAQSTVDRLFSKRDWNRVRDELFPSEPELISESSAEDFAPENREGIATTDRPRITLEDRNRIARLLAAMPRRLKRMMLPLPQNFAEVAEVLQKELVEGEVEEADRS